MKGTKNLVSLAALIAARFALSFVPVSFAAEKSKPVLSKHELKVLLKTAKNLQSTGELQSTTGKRHSG